MVSQRFCARAALILALASGCGAVRAARFLDDALRPPGELTGVTERWERIAGVRVRFAQARDPVATVLLIHGAVEDGAEDPRLVSLARALAKQGARVAAPDLVNLRRYAIDARDPDTIARLALLLDGPVALAGISIGGSYALVAAGREDLRGKLTCVFAFGAYADLEALLYGWLVEPRETPELYDPLVEGRRRVLNGNRHRLDPRLVRECTASQEPLPPATARAVLAPLKHELAALEPRRACAPVYLLHGANDPVVPVDQARELAARLDPVELHVTALFDHVDAEKRPSFLRAWPLLRFIDRVLDAMRMSR